jgi:hypothetical protein
MTTGTVLEVSPIGDKLLTLSAGGSAAGSAIPAAIKAAPRGRQWNDASGGLNPRRIEARMRPQQSGDMRGEVSAIKTNR